MPFTFSTTNMSETIKSLILNVIKDNKGDDTVCIDVKHKTSITDYVIITSSTSTRHSITLAQKVMYELKKLNIYAVSDGLDYGNWIAIDMNSIILHIFKPEVRIYYNIEAIWQ